MSCHRQPALPPSDACALARTTLAFHCSKPQHLGRWLMSAFLGFAACLAAGQARSQLELLPEPGTHHVFGGRPQSIRVLIRNPGNRQAEVPIQTRLYQASSATLMPVGEAQSWKTLTVLPGQTVVETVPVVLPAVRAETRFLLHWHEDARRHVGRCELIAYPTNLLAELKTLAGEQPIGVFDPANRLKPLLRALEAEFADLERLDVQHFPGQLAFFGPFASPQQIPSDLVQRTAARCKAGLAAVWIQPPDRNPSRVEPTFYPVAFGDGLAVIAQASLIAHLDTDPLAQRNLIRLTRLALQRQPLAWPEPTPGH